MELSIFGTMKLKIKLDQCHLKINLLHQLQLVLMEIY